MKGTCSAELLAAVATGNRNAFALLYDQMAAKLFGVLLRLLKDRDDAEDALQEVFLKIFHRAGQFRAGEAAPEAWLIAIARNHAIDRLRGRRQPAEPLDTHEGDGLANQLPDPAPSPEANAMTAQDRRRLDDCLETLADDRAEAVRRAYLSGESYQDLAARFEVPLNTMRSWLRRALIKLRECLQHG